MVPCPHGDIDAARKCCPLNFSRFVLIDSQSKTGSHMMSSSGVVSRKCWKLVGGSVAVACCVTKSRCSALYSDVFTVLFRILLCIVRHSSAAMVFLTILNLRFDASMVSGFYLSYFLLIVFFSKVAKKWLGRHHVTIAII